MPREVLTTGDIQKFNQSEASSRIPAGTTYPVTKDGYFDRLFKYIPAELVAGYIFVMGVVKQLTDAGEIKILQWSLFVVFCVLTPLYLWRVQKVLKLQQHFISLLSLWYGFLHWEDLSLYVHGTIRFMVQYCSLYLPCSWQYGKPNRKIFSNFRNYKCVNKENKWLRTFESSVFIFC